MGKMKMIVANEKREMEGIRQRERMQCSWLFMKTCAKYWWKFTAMNIYFHKGFCNVSVLFLACVNVFVD